MVFYFIYKILCLVFLSPSRHTYKYVPASVIRPAVCFYLIFLSPRNKTQRGYWWWPSDERHNRPFAQHSLGSFWSIKLYLWLPPFFFLFWLLFYSWNECYIILAPLFVYCGTVICSVIWSEPLGNDDGYMFVFFFFLFLYLCEASASTTRKDRRAAGYVYDPARSPNANAWCAACKSFGSFSLSIINDDVMIKK